MDMLSPASFEHFVRTYGYWALLAGTFLEGETILIIAGFLARLGRLDLLLVIAVAFVGSFSGDQMYFYIGRLKGGYLLAKYPKLRGGVDKVHRVTVRYHNLIMLGFRFIYGMRIMTPFVIGMDLRIGTMRFTVLNAAGALLWSMVIPTAGYLFGTAVEAFIKDIAHYETAVLIGILCAGLGLWIFHKYRAGS